MSNRIVLHFVYVCSGLFLLSLFLVIRLQNHPSSFVDIHVYLKSYEDFKEGRNVYEAYLSTFPHVDRWGKYFTYLPPFIVIGFFISLFPAPCHFFFFQGLSLLCFYISFFLIFRYFTGNRNLPLQFFVVSCLLFVFPFQHTFAVGQVNAFLLLFISLFLVCVKNGKPYAAAFFLLPAALAKVFPAVMSLSLLKLSRRSFIFFVVICLCSVAASYAVFPSDTEVFFKDVVPRRFVLVQSGANQSLALFLSRMNFPSYALMPFLLLVLPLSYLRFSSAVEISFFLLVFSFLFTPLSWIHHFILLYPAYARFAGKTKVARALAFLSFFLVSFPPPMRTSVFVCTFMPLYGLILLAVLLWHCAESKG